MLTTFLAVTQVLFAHGTSGWTSNTANLESDLNTKLKNLELSIDPTRQTIEIKDIKLNQDYAVIIYEITDLIDEDFE